MKAKLPNLALLVGLAAVYFLAGKLGMTMALADRIVSPVWPPAGIALAAVLLLGDRVWPGLLLGAFLTIFTSMARMRGDPLIVVVASLGVALGNTLEALAGAWLVERFAKGRAAFQQPHTVLLFVALAGILGTAISATIGASACALAGFEKWPAVSNAWLTWWLGDIVGVVVITPLILVWSTRRLPAFNLKRLYEAGALLLLLLLVCQVAFGGWFDAGAAGGPLAFLVIPILLWTALRFGQRGTVSVIFIVACLATIGTLRDHGPFAAGNRSTSLLLLQHFIAVVALMSLMLAADVVQRRRIDAGLRASEQRYRELFERNPQPMWVYDYETLRFLAVNNAAVCHYGYSREEFLSMAITDIRPPEEIPALLEAVARARSGQDIPSQWHHRRKDGTIIDVETRRHNLLFYQRPAAMVLSTDITERKRAEKRAAAFSELGRRLSAASTPREAAQIIAETADGLFGWDACMLDLCVPGQAMVETVFSMDLIEGRRTEIASRIRKPGACACQVLAEGAQLVLRPDPPGFSPEVTPFGDKTRPSASMMFVPLRTDNKAIGIFSIQSYSAKAYTEEDLRTLQALADHCGGALDRIRAEEEIERLNRELRRHVEELELLLDVAPVGIAVARDPECRVITGNPACAAILGTNGTANLSKSGPEAGQLPHKFLCNGKEVPPEQLPMQYAASKGVPVDGQELDIVLRDGRVVNSYIYAAPLFDETGRVRGSLGVIIDLTEHKRAEQEILRLNSELERRVSERTAQLEAINKELEAFAYSVSHDLRAPLRSIRGFSEVLLERYAAKLDARGQEFLRRACQSSQHMDRLIEDLLKLSRLGRSEMQRRPVKLSALAESIAAELRQAEPGRAVEWIIAPDLHGEGDERLLRVVLENLLRNAWKFTSKQPSARIEFGRAGAHPHPTFFVRDNGAGFDMAHAAKLFGVFQRLHSAGEFPGTGIGLATVQRIINRHGGRAWAEGAINQGATFYFTLPAHERF